MPESTSCISGCNPGSTPPEVPFLFWWEGPDGSRLLTMYSANYGNGLLPPAGWKHKTWIAMIMGSDNQPPPSPEKVREHIAEIHAKLPGVKVRIGSLGDFGDRMMKEDLGDLAGHPRGHAGHLDPRTDVRSGRDRS